MGQRFVNKPTPYSAFDREIVVLAAVWDLIASMVHYAHFEKEHRLEDATLMFRSREASKLFLIILADFLSLPGRGVFGLRAPSGNGCLGSTYLGLMLDHVVAAPHFSGDPTPLATVVRGFATWLDGEISVHKVWLPSIDREGTIRVRRASYLKICGTASKHGFTRLADIVGKVRTILDENGTTIDEGQSYLVLPEFQEWFQNIFIASSTTIAWYLNEIRWAIYCYLRPEFGRSYHHTDVVQGLQMYAYHVPEALTDPLVRSMYWDLMNHMRSEPYFPRFTVSPYLRKEY